jgi:hypothetical protein
MNMTVPTILFLGMLGTMCYATYVGGLRIFPFASFFSLMFGELFLASAQWPRDYMRPLGYFVGALLLAAWALGVRYRKSEVRKDGNHE